MPSTFTQPKRLFTQLKGLCDWKRCLFVWRSRSIIETKFYSHPHCVVKKYHSESGRFLFPSPVVEHFCACNLHFSTLTRHSCLFMHVFVLILQPTNTFITSYRLLSPVSWAPGSLIPSFFFDLPANKVACTPADFASCIPGGRVNSFFPHKEFTETFLTWSCIFFCLSGFRL